MTRYATFSLLCVALIAPLLHAFADFVDRVRTAFAQAFPVASVPIRPEIYERAPLVLGRAEARAWRDRFLARQIQPDHRGVMLGVVVT